MITLISFPFHYANNVMDKMNIYIISFTNEEVNFKNPYENIILRRTQRGFLLLISFSFLELRKVFVSLFYTIAHLLYHKFGLS